jgi:hypothetical protein
LLLEEAGGVIVRSTPKDVIRASRRAELLTDEDAEEAIRMTDDRNQTVHMYKEELGEGLAERLPQYTMVLHRWLNALSDRAGPSLAYRLFEQAMAERKQIVCVYDGCRRELCPIILGHTQGEEKALTYQFAGESKSRLPPGGQWKCFWLSGSVTFNCVTAHGMAAPGTAKRKPASKSLIWMSTRTAHTILNDSCPPPPQLNHIGEAVNKPQHAARVGRSVLGIGAELPRRCP